MRFYPLHIFIKDITFITIYSLVPDSNWISFDPGVEVYLVIVLSVIVVNFIVHTILYYGFGRYLKFRSRAKQFLFGIVLHLPTVLLCLRWDLHSDSDPFPFQAAIVSSGIISGISYVLLNNKSVAEVLRNRLGMVRKEYPTNPYRS